MDKENRDYAWKYFSLHADQRLKTFHFFVVLSALISGATLTIVKSADNIAYAIPMTYILSFLAFIFWKLDQRNRGLIKHAEDALKSIEKTYTDPENTNKRSIKLFLEEETKTRKNKQSYSIIDMQLSYSNCFNSVFFVFGFIAFIFGTAILIISVMK